MESLIFDGALEIRVSGAARALAGGFPLGRTATRGQLRRTQCAKNVFQAVAAGDARSRGRSGSLKSCRPNCPR